MKIIKLVAENIKRLHAVSITPDGAIITIGGKNGAGKSSVLDSIAYAMGGEKLVPSEPIRTGESEAKIVVDLEMPRDDERAVVANLGDLVVTRKFRREKIVNQADPLGAEQSPTIWSETKSTLTVTNKDGTARYSSPQAMLERLYGKLTFDALAFARMDVKAQNDTLRKLVGLDVAPIETRRKAAFDQRALLKKTHAIREAQLAAMPFVKDMPTAEVPMEVISQEMLKAEEYRKLAEDADRGVDRVRTIVADVENRKALLRDRLEDMRKQVDALEAELGNAEMKLESGRRALDAAKITAQAARAVVPDANAIRVKIKNTEVVNAAVRANQRRAEAMAEVDRLAHQVSEQTTIIGSADEAKKHALENAKFPVVGLGLSDEGVTFNGLPFAQAGSAEQLRVSVAIGIALNSQLKVLLIPNGNLLDKDSLAAVAAQAEAAEMQVWMEVVTEDSEGVSVMLVDGEVV